MSWRERLTRAYFDAVYNPLYDVSTARMARYTEAQTTLAERLRVGPGQRILCAGLGTGNELTSLRSAEPCLRLVGIDVSRAALRKARARPAGDGPSAACALMDVEMLGFSGGAFDRVLCYHVLDFISEADAAVEEFLRVLKPGGRFVISFPADGEGPGLGAALVGHGLRSRQDSLLQRTGHALRTMLAGLIYLPLLLRRRPTTYTPSGIDALLRSRGAEDVEVMSDPIYRDHIATGAKKKGG